MQNHVWAWEITTAKGNSFDEKELGDAMNIIDRLNEI